VEEMLPVPTVILISTFLKSDTGLLCLEKLPTKPNGKRLLVVTLGF